MKEERIQCEMKDITEAIRRFLVANNYNVCFVGSFIAFKNICEDCLKKKKEDPVKNEATRLFAYGPKGTLRLLLEELRDAVEDEANEDNWVNL